jgi:hypothetical protein
MKVKELIKILQKLDPEILVLVDGYEGGYAIPVGTKQIEVCGPFKREWYYGEYDDCREAELFKTKAILLPRKNYVS